jgi:hypothetical protein
MQELRRFEPARLSEAEVESVLREFFKEWLSQPEQKASFDEFGHRDKAFWIMIRYRFQRMVNEKFGGLIWLQVLICTGYIPNRALKMANLDLQKELAQKYKAPASSPGPAFAGEPIGSQLRVSAAKRQRVDERGGFCQASGRCQSGVE